MRTQPVAVRKQLASAVCILGSAAAFMLEYGDGIPKIPLIWVHTLMSLVLLFHFAPPGSSYGLDSHRSRILHKLQHFGVHPDTLHYSSFEEPNTVHCIFQVDFEFSRLRTGYRQPSSLLYVGSTAVGAAKRHFMAAYRRLKKTEFVDAELLLRYWASHDNLFQFALVPLQSYENYQLAWVTEHELIAQWQTPLNYPRAMALIKKTALGFRISSKRRASLYGTFGLRLWRELHKWMHRGNQRFFIKDSRELAWGSLFKLGSRTRAVFDTSKLLRPRQTADEEVYALIKLSRNIESPSQPSSRVAQECGQVSHQDALAQNIQAFGCSAIAPPTLHSAMREVAAKHYPSVQIFVPFFSCSQEQPQRGSTSKHKEVSSQLPVLGRNHVGPSF